MTASVFQNVSKLSEMSVGRRPMAETLGLDGTAVVADARGFVEVDAWCRTAEPGVYAVGDLIATPALAHRRAILSSPPVTRSSRTDP